jgi:hypothetical protein
MRDFVLLVALALVAAAQIGVTYHAAIVRQARASGHGNQRQYLD